MIPLPRLLDSNGAEVRRIRPVSLSITENLVPLSTAQMVLTPDEEIPARSYIELFTPNGLSAVYRTRIPAIGYGQKSNSVDLEHACCEIGDWLIRKKYDQQEKHLDEIISSYWEQYRGSKWQLGTVSVTSNVIIQEDYPNVLQAILSAVSQIPSAVINFDFSTSPWTLNVGTREATVSAEGRLSRNIQSAVVQPDDSKLCTRVYLEGLAQGGGVGHLDADTISTYGVIETKLSDGDYTAAQAQAVAQNYLNRYKRPIYSVQINGLDLSAITGESLDLMRVGKKYRLAIPDEASPVQETITQLRWANVYDAPNQVTIQLSEQNERVLKWLKKDSNYEKTFPVINSRTDGTRARISNNGSSIVLSVGIGDDTSAEANFTTFTVEGDKVSIRAKSTGIDGTTCVFSDKKILLQTGMQSNLEVLELNGEDGKIFVTYDGTKYEVAVQQVTIGGTQYKLLKLTEV